MVRETLNAGANHVFLFDYSTSILLTERTSTGASSSYQSMGSGTVPNWMKLVRSGNVFSMYGSADGVNWVALGTSQTVSMGPSVYIGLAVSNRTTASLATATFDSVSVSSAAAPAPVISGVSATTGLIGSQVVISGSSFRSPQGGSAVLLNGTAVTINAWSSTSITMTIPAGATTGAMVVSVAPGMNDSNAVRFTVTSQPLPASWLDQDVGAVGIAGSASFANGTFTVTGAGQGTFFTSSDGLHFVYQLLAGDGTMVARVVSVQGSSAAQVGIMVRETLNAGANHVYLFDYSTSILLTERTSTGASSSYQSMGSGTVPNWMKLVRSGNVFSVYGSADGVNWVALGTSQTVSMGPSVYIGLAVSNRTTASLATATFDNVSLTSPGPPAPVISGVSATTGLIGSQVVISGTGFGSPQGGSAVLLNGAAVTINAWSSTSITMTIPAGATTGAMVVSVAPGMNDSNAVRFTVTSQPLPASWLDQDVGAVGIAGSASFANGTFTVTGAGQGTFFTSSDGLHFVYQPLAGDGTMVARVVSVQGSSAAQVGIMVRETLNAGANHVYLFDYSTSILLTERTSTGASSSYQSMGSGTVPNWMKLVRSGNVFSVYGSADGVNWVALGTSQTVSMAVNVYN